MFHSLGHYDNLQKALVIKSETGDREGQVTDYGNLGAVFQSLGEYDKAIEHLQKALVIRTEISDREGDATDYGNLGTVFLSLSSSTTRLQSISKKRL